jgi:hypothetical protein
VLDEDARRRFRRDAVAKRIPRWEVQVHARREHAIDAAQRALELTGEARDELRLLRGLARHELTAIGRIGEATRSRARELLVAHRREGARRVVARDVDPELPLGLGVGLFHRVDPGLIERDHDAVRVRLVERRRDRHRASDQQRDRSRGEDRHASA